MVSIKSQSAGHGTRLRKQQPAFVADKKAVDPDLASLFASSLSAGQNPAGSAIKITGSATDRQSREADTASSSELIIDEDLETESANGQDSDSLANGDEDNETKDAVAPHHSSSTEYVTKQGRKRKHHGAEDDLETTYMRRLAKEEASEEQSRHAERSQKRQKSFQDTHTAVTNTLDSVPSEIRQVVDLEGSTEDNGEYPLQHETLTPSKESFELEKSSRTVFLANVSISAIRSKTCKKVLLEHLASFIPSLSKEKVPHKVESIRFRSTAFSITAVPKKAAFAKRELMDATTRSTNAYAVYSTSLAAREAAKRLNGTMVLDRHLRVDGVAHPAKTDNRRCVFVGNLGFVDDESSLNAANDEENEKKPRKAKPVADVEEGLWRQFGKAGTVESVRVVRDKSTRVGKGIAYVQYMDPNAVEAALLFNDKKFPPLLPRKLRVTRAKSIKKTTSYSTKSKPSVKVSSKNEPSTHYIPKPNSQAMSLQGRAGKLLGQAGAAKLISKRRYSQEGSKISGEVTKTPEAIVFEGYRATRKQGKGGSKTKGAGKKQGKPKTRSSKRGAAFKASGGRKTMA